MDLVIFVVLQFLNVPKEIRIVDKIYFPHSLGVFYETFTQLIGFQKYGEEYKMMGLSSYGEPNIKTLY